MRIDHDGIFKQLLEEFFVEFLELFVPDALQLLDASTLTFLDKQVFRDLLDPDRREADLVVQAQYRHQPTTFIVHLEHQAQEDKALHQRMFRYFAKFHDRYAAAVYPIALCSYHTPKQLAPDQYVVGFPDFAVLDFRFRVVQLNQLRWRDYLDHPNPLATALLARMQVGPRERRAVKAACLAHLVGLPISAKRRRIISQFLEVYLPLDPQEERLLHEQLPELAPYQQEEPMIAIVTSWERMAGVTLVTEVLEKRFGPLDDTVTAQIADYPYDVLRALNIAQVTFTTLADLEDWLAANPVPPWVDPLGEWDDSETSLDAGDDAPTPSGGVAAAPLHMYRRNGKEKEVWAQ
ncbi:DUF4351 domain-containing protein [Candidatus Gracilibacteria bacterium]|nr:DUF4351 domain-containing protein [Candidatus Gracilibacteria bacterium]